MVADELWRNRNGQMPQINCRSFVCKPMWFRSPRRVKNVCGQCSQLYFRICVWHSMWLFRSNFLRKDRRQKSHENFIGSVLWTSWCLYSRAEFLKDDGQSVHTKALEKNKEREIDNGLKNSNGCACRKKIKFELFRTEKKKYFHRMTPVYLTNFYKTFAVYNL